MTNPTIDTATDSTNIPEFAALSGSLRALSNAVAPAGMEAEVRKLIMEQIRDHVTDLHIDSIGNVTAIKRQAGGESNGEERPALMLVAHMDEPGFIVTEVGDDGLISVEAMGSFDPRYLGAAQVQIGKDKIPGVFTWKPIHHDRSMDIRSLDDTAIDVGASNAGGTCVKVGDRAALYGEYQRIESGDLVRGKAFESRIGCAILLALVTGDDLPIDVSVAFLTQHTIETRGAGIAASRLKPTSALVFTGVEAFDLPRDEDLPEHYSAVHVGHGPVLMVGERRHIGNYTLIRALEQIAEQTDQPVQKQFAGRSDAALIAHASSGVSLATVGVPMRYPSSANNVASLRDIDATIRLVRVALSQFPLS